MSAYFPTFQKIDENHKILVIGGGSVATAKIEAMMPHKKYMRVKSLNFRHDLLKTLHKHDIDHETGSYTHTDLTGISIVVAATNNRELNKRIKTEANAKGILVNCVDDKELCDFIFPALVRRGDLQIAISSAGISPVLARLVKRSVEQLFPSNFEDVIEFLRSKRRTVIEKLTHLQPRRLFWEKFLCSQAIDHILAGNDNKAEDAFHKALLDQSNDNNAALYLIGALW